MAFDYKEIGLAEVPSDTGNDRASTSRHQLIKLRIHWLIHAICVLGMMVMFFLIYPTLGFKNSCITPGKNYHRMYSPIWDIVTYSIKTYDHAQLEFHNSTSPFKGYPRPELEAAWAGILNHSYNLIPKSGMEALGQRSDNAVKHGNGYVGYIDVFHQLHCMDLIRKYIYRAGYPDYPDFQDSDERILWHVDHCIDVLRQKIMCDSDIDVITFIDQSDIGKLPWPRFNIPHMCRDYEAIQKWSLEHPYAAA